MQWIVDDCSRGDITCALDRVNLYFKDNIRLDGLADMELDEDGVGKWSFSLHVVSRLGPGHIFNRPPTKLYIPFTTQGICWDVRFLFYYELPDHAKVEVGNHWLSRADDLYPVQYINKSGVIYSLLDCCECEERKRHLIHHVSDLNERIDLMKIAA
jgi:hypothetical protein